MTTCGGADWFSLQNYSKVQKGEKKANLNFYLALADAAIMATRSGTVLEECSRVQFTGPPRKILRWVVALKHDQEGELRCPMFWAGGRRAGKFLAPLACSDLHKKKVLTSGKNMNRPINIPVGTKTGRSPIIRAIIQLATRPPRNSLGKLI
jgi:hypothetical protein